MLPCTITCCVTVYTDSDGREYISMGSERLYLDELSQGDARKMDRQQLEATKLKNDAAAHELESRKRQYEDMAAGVIEEQQMMDDY